MWIRTLHGEYVNLDHVRKFKLNGVTRTGKPAHWDVAAAVFENGSDDIAQFETRAEAEAYLDALIRTFGQVGGDKND